MDVEPEVDFYGNKNTNMKKIQITIMAAALFMAAQARATWYDIGFTASDNSILMNGTVNVDASGLATSGSMTVFTGPSAMQGTFNLAPGGPGQTVSATLGGQSFTYDNMVYGIATVPFLDNWGLLFANNESVLQINLWGNSASNNGYETAALYVNGILTDVTGGASISLAPVPEASTMVAGALMLLPFGVSALRIMRKKAIA